MPVPSLARLTITKINFMLQDPEKDNVIQSLDLNNHVNNQGKRVYDGVFGGPAYFRSHNSQFIYYAGKNDNLKAFELKDGQLSPSGHSSHIYGGGFGGASIPSISSSHSKAGTGIVWILEGPNMTPDRVSVTTPPAIINLHAYDATNLSNKLGEWPAGIWYNNYGGAFITPTVVNGKVYVGSSGLLRVFGL